jgi:hypothetical protein
VANYQYSSDLLDEILDRAGELTDGTSDFEASALQYLNRAYRGILSGGSELDPNIHEQWWWLRSTAEGNLILLPEQSGSATVTNNNASVTLSAVQTPSIDEYYIRFDGTADVFRVSTHTAGTDAVTLDSVYTGATGSATWEAWKTDYDLASDVLSLIGPLRCNRLSSGEIQYVSEQDFQRLYPMKNLNDGVPTHFTFVGERTVRFNKGGGDTSTDYVRVDYSYTDMPAALTDSGSEEPLVPLQYRHVLADWGAAMLLADKDDDRAPYFIQSAQRIVAAMAKEHRRRMGRSSRDFGRIKPRVPPTLKNELKTASGLVVE